VELTAGIFCNLTYLRYHWILRLAFLHGLVYPYFRNDVSHLTDAFIEFRIFMVINLSPWSFMPVQCVVGHSFKFVSIK
jgi:hypothetical protein